VEIRAAVASDAIGLARELKSVADEGRWVATQGDRSVDELTERFGNLIQGEHIIFVLEHDGQIVGHVGIHPTGVEGVDSLGMSIVQEFRGQGWGRRLVTTALDAARERRIRKVVLEVFSDNARAIALYLSTGFEIEGYKRDHYLRLDGSLRSAVLMARFL
jgi:ribosomal protein S18 acetylase RimI-like enzyme